MTQRIAYVTGGMGGIGTSICQRLAKDGYKALMAGEHRIISGFMNNVQVGMSKVTPDPLVAARYTSKAPPSTATSAASSAVAQPDQAFSPR